MSTIQLDAGMATTLERSFKQDLSDYLWSAGCLQNNPDAIKGTHALHLKAGAEIITTCTYQASFQGFQRAGYSEQEAMTTMLKGVELANEAKKECGKPNVRVALSIGPYGAMLANGAEYTGDYHGMTGRELEEFHRRRLNVFFSDGNPQNGIDMILFETIPCYQEAQAIQQLLKHVKYPVPVMVSFSCNSSHTVCHGEPISDCVALFNDMDQVIAVGVNCTKPRYISSLLQDIKSTAPNKTIIVYPDGGEEWDAEARSWVSGSQVGADAFGRMCKKWADQFGPDIIIGGCCGTTQEHIASITQNITNRQ
ncbi:hypothetical protein NQZ79_g8459 [Umbelopsis isabellina]|nr:hypothetical protein NQZ79_g8459 [Umbelopsis isabellina]